MSLTVDTFWINQGAPNDEFWAHEVGDPSTMLYQVSLTKVVVLEARDVHLNV